MSDLSERLRQARIAAGYASAADAARAVGVPEPSYTAHENGSRGFKYDRAKLYSRRFGVSLEWLLSGRGDTQSAQPLHEPHTETDIQMRPLVGTVQAGVWQEPFDSGEVDLVQLPIPSDRLVPGAQQFWFEIVGDSVNQFVGDGGRIFCTSVWDWARDSEDLFRRANGKLVVAERRRADGTFQRTCKRLVVAANGRAALHTASSHPRWKNEAPIALNENGDTVDVTVVAVVTDLLTAAP